LIVQHLNPSNYVVGGVNQFFLLDL